MTYSRHSRFGGALEIVFGILMSPLQLKLSLMSPLTKGPVTCVYIWWRHYDVYSNYDRKRGADTWCRSALAFNWISGSLSWPRLSWRNHNDYIDVNIVCYLYHTHRPKTSKSVYSHIIAICCFIYIYIYTYNTYNIYIYHRRVCEIFTYSGII